MLRTFAELGTVHRGDPCLEYPGEWLLFVPCELEELGSLPANYQQSHPSQEAAQRHGEEIINQLEELRVEYNVRAFSVCWKCSDNDPRVGEVWFTGFYKHGQWSVWGQYRPT